MDRVDQAIERANQGLNRIKIVCRGRKLSLRGSLPKKPGEGRGNRQQTIALGIFANPEGVKVALAKAQRLESDLNLDRFQWSDWAGGGSSVGGKTAADWGKEFGVIKAGSIKPQSYHANYEEPLASLPDKPLSEEMLIAHVLKRSKPDSWGRKNDCMVFRQVAKFAGLTVDFSQVRGRYRPTPVSPDDLPSDDDIEAIWEGLANPGWRWVYGIVFTVIGRIVNQFKG